MIATAESFDCRTSTICFISNIPELIWPNFDYDIFVKSLNFDHNFKKSKRYTAFYGTSRYSYGYTTHEPISISQNKYLLRFANSLSKHYAGLNFNTILINYYPHNCSHLPYHADNEIEIEPNSFIFTLSLGSSRKIMFRDISSKNVLLDITLSHGSQICFSRKSQDYFEHSIPQTDGNAAVCSAGIHTSRTSLTFRNIK